MTFEELKPRFEALQDAKLSAAGVDTWMAEWSALWEEIAEERAMLFIRTACDTTNKADEEAQRKFQSEVIPKLEEVDHALQVKLMDSGFDPRGLEIFMRAIRSYRDVYREENLALQVRVSELENEQTRIAGAQSVFFEGEERTLRQLAPFLELKDRGLRERAWMAGAERRAKDVPRLDEVFEGLMQLRVKMAANAGFESYAQFRYREYCRLDYSVQDALALHGRIFAAFEPLISRMNRWKAADLGLASLKPWDLAYDSTGADPLKPFTSAKELYLGVKRIYAHLDAEPAALLDDLWQKKRLDLDSRIGKAPGGFNYGLPKSKSSFIFWNSAGMQMDVMVLAHEGGHAYQGKLSEKLPLLFQRESPMEFAELASMGMELQCLPHLEEFYGPRDADRARLDYLWDIPASICRIAAVDLFQHRLYAKPGMSAAERHACFLEVIKPVYAGIDISGLEEILSQSWQATLHIFRFPFYYLDYAFAQMGALQIWEAGLSDPKLAFKKYREGISLGGTKTLPELYAAAGTEFLVSDGRLKSLATTLEQEINANLIRLGKSSIN